MKKSILFCTLFSLLLFSSCSYRLLDFTVVSSKNTNLNIPSGAKGERVEGKSMGVFSIGVNIKEAVDAAIENAGPEYDALIDGVLSSKSYYFYGGYICEGTPINTEKLQAYWGEEKFENWAQNHDIRYKNRKDKEAVAAN